MRTALLVAALALSACATTQAKPVACCIDSDFKPGVLAAGRPHGCACVEGRAVLTGLFMVTFGPGEPPAPVPEPKR